MTASDPDLLIVGSGPAGVSTWLHLEALAPELAANALVIDRAVHPREKPCGGGLTVLGDQILSGLGIEINGPAARVETIEFRLAGRVRQLRRPGLLRVVHRAEFDHALVTAARERGMRLQEGEAFLTFTRDDDRLLVRTDHGEYRVRALVGADGAYSRVRRAMASAGPGHLARLLEVVTEAPAETPPGVAVFDFGVRETDIDGYTWNFPCFRGGVPATNHGVFDAGWPGRRTRPSLHDALGAALGGSPALIGPVEGHPIRLFDPGAPCSEPHVVLAGDAAGVDAMLGEGIAQALDYGDLTARIVIDAFARSDFSFAGHRSMLLAHPLGHALLMRRRLATVLYEGRRSATEVWAFVEQWLPEPV